LWISNHGTLTEGEEGSVQLTSSLRFVIKFCKKKTNIVSVWKVADLNKLVQGGQPYWSFPFSKAFLVQKPSYIVIGHISHREKKLFSNFLKTRQATVAQWLNKWLMILSSRVQIWPLLSPRTKEIEDRKKNLMDIFLNNPFKCCVLA